MGAIFKAWVWRLAWRDGRQGLRPLLFSMSSVILAVAAVVAAFSFRDNLLSNIQTQSKSLLGADLALDSREPFSAEDENLFRSLGGEQARLIGFASMVFFPRGGDSRLMQVRAISGAFPFYGALESTPPLSLAEFHRGANALVDENVMLQFNAQVGDRLKIGEYEFRIAGKLRKIPGETLAFSLISPRVYIPMAYLDRTELLQKGSLVRYRVYFKLQPDTDVDRLVGNLAPKLQQLRLEADTVSKRSESIAASMENLSRYLTPRGLYRRASFGRRGRQRRACLRHGQGAIRGATPMYRRRAARNCLRICDSSPFVGVRQLFARHRFRRGRAVRIAARAQRFSTFDDGGFARAPGHHRRMGGGTGYDASVRSDSVTAAAKYLAAVGAARDLRCRPAGARLADVDFFALIGAGIWAFAVATTVKHDLRFVVCGRTVGCVWCSDSSRARGFGGDT